MRDSVGQLIDQHPEVEALGVESPPFGELWSEGLYGLFLYVTEAIFTRRKDVVFFDPLSVKLLAKMDPKIRRGKMDKRDMVEAARVDTAPLPGVQGSLLPKIPRWNHNEADAYIIARSAARFWEFQMKGLREEELTPSELHVFARTHRTRTGQIQKRGLVFREDDRFHRFSSLTPAEIVVEP